MEQDRLGGADDPRGRLGPAHPLGELGAEDGGDAEAAHPLDHVDEALPGLRDRRELVHDQEHPLAARLAPDRPLGELVNQEAGEVAGLLLEPQPVEQEVGSVELVEGDLSVERGADGSEEGGVAGADPVQLRALERCDLDRGRGAPRVEAEQRLAAEAGE